MMCRKRHGMRKDNQLNFTPIAIGLDWKNADKKGGNFVIVRTRAGCDVRGYQGMVINHFT